MRLAGRLGLGLALAASTVSAAPSAGPPRPVLTALVAVDDDARHAVALGPSAQRYTPDGHGGWARTAGGGVAGDVAVATAEGGALRVGDGQALYELTGDGWVALHPTQRGRATLGRGGRPLAAVGRVVIDLAHPKAIVGTAPAEITALAAGGPGGKGGGRVVVATAKGLAVVALDRVTALAAPAGAALVSDGWATSPAGALDLRGGQTTAWPPGRALQTAAAGPGDELVVVLAGPEHLELAVLRRGQTTFTTTPAPLPVTARARGVVLDRAGRAALATEDGQVLVWADGRWAVTTVVDRLPPDRPGPTVAPAG